MNVPFPSQSAQDASLLETLSTAVSRHPTARSAPRRPTIDPGTVPGPASTQTPTAAIMAAPRSFASQNGTYTETSDPARAAPAVNTTATSAIARFAAVRIGMCASP